MVLRAKVKNQIEKFLLNHLVSPPFKAPYTRMWLNSSLQYIDDSDKGFQTIISWYNRLMRTWTIKQIYNFYKKKRNVFGAIDKPFSRIYYSRQESLKCLDIFLAYQFNCDYVRMNTFPIYLLAWLEEECGKKNTLVLLGNANCGKSWFINSIKNLVITHGGSSILNKNNQFGLGDAIGVKLIVLDELSFDNETWLENLKKLFSGEDTLIQKKYKDGAMITKTPVVVMSNKRDIIPPGDAFKERCHTIDWKAVTSVVSLVCRKRLHPFAIIEKVTNLIGRWPTSTILQISCLLEAHNLYSRINCFNWWTWTDNELDEFHVKLINILKDNPENLGIEDAYEHLMEQVEISKNCYENN